MYCVGVYTSDETKFYEAISRYSMYILNTHKQQNILKNYYTFMMYRNPVERLFSAYRDKVEKYPMLGLQELEPHFNWVRLDIYRYKHPWKFRQWKKLNGTKPVNISFPDFIDYWIHEIGHELQDHHFLPIFDICQPCQVRYDYYGKFSTLERDAEVLLSHVGGNMSLLDVGYYSKKGTPSSDLAPKYYNLLSRKQKKDILKKLSLDLHFYYTIFPEERDHHRVIMDTDIELPAPTIIL